MNSRPALIKNLTVFFRVPDLESDPARCGVCGALCQVSHNQLTPTSLAEALAARSGVCALEPWDVHSCPNVSSDWHRAAESLVTELRGLRSPSLRRLVRADIMSHLIDAQPAAGISAKHALIGG